MRRKKPKIYDTPKMRRDMIALGWLPADLAKASGVSHTSVGRFFLGTFQTPRVAKKLADALGRDLRDYLLDRPSLRRTA